MNLCYCCSIRILFVLVFIFDNGLRWGISLRIFLLNLKKLGWPPMFWGLVYTWVILDSPYYLKSRWTIFYFLPLLKVFTCFIPYLFVTLSVRKKGILVSWIIIIIWNNPFQHEHLIKAVKYFLRFISNLILPTPYKIHKEAIFNFKKKILKQI